jgi:hypothetical protein
MKALCLRPHQALSAVLEDAAIHIDFVRGAEADPMEVAYLVMCPLLHFAMCCASFVSTDFIMHLR